MVRTPVATGASHLTYDVSLLTPAQHHTFQQIIGTPDYNESANPGTPQNPIYLRQGALPPAGASYVDTDGRVHPGDLNTAPGDQRLGFVEGLTNPFINAGQWALNGVQRLAGPQIAHTLDAAGNAMVGLPPTEQVVAGRLQDRRQRMIEGYRPGVEGEAVGALLNPMNYMVRNPVVGGAVAGGLGGSIDRNPSDVLADTVGGAVTGGVTHGAVRMAGAAAAPAISPEVRALHAEHVPMTIGDILGGTVRKIETVGGFLPFVGDMIQNQRERGLHGFNRAGANRALAPLDETLPDGIRPGHTTIQHVQQRFAHAYEDITPQIRVHLDRPWQDQLTAQIAHIRDGGLSDELRTRFNTFLRREVLGRRMESDGSMTGQAFRDADETLGREAEAYSGTNANPADREYGNQIRQLQTNLRELAYRSSPPRVAARLQAINEGYSNLVRIETAAANTSHGIYTPEQLRAATLRHDNTAHDRASAAGRARMQDLASAGSGVLPSTSENGSGGQNMMTRSLINLGGAGALGGAALALHPNPLLVAGLGSTLLPYTNTGQRVVQGALLNRPNWAPYVRSAIDASALPISQTAAVVGQANENNNRLRDNVVDGFGR